VDVGPSAGGDGDLGIWSTLDTHFKLSTSCSVRRISLLSRHTSSIPGFIFDVSTLVLKINPEARGFFLSPVYLSSKHMTRSKICWSV